MASAPPACSLLKLAVALFVLNAIDTFSTYFGVQTGYMVEVNPLVSALWDIHPKCFILFKLLVGFVASFALTLSDTKTTRRIAYAVVGAYGLLVIWHASLWLWLLLMS